MQSNKLTTEKVVPRSNVRRERDVHTTSVCKQSIDCPLSIGVSILIDLEPHVSSSSIGLGKVHNDGSYVCGIDNVV
jgi:hypothetical protein